MALGGGVVSAAAALMGKGSSPSASPSAVVPELEAAKANFIKSGPGDGKRIALTFDDGPVPGVTDPILDELKRRNVHATFFMMGKRVAASPDLARRVLAEGHEAGNHSYTHPKLTTLPDAQVIEEIQKTQAIMDEVLNQRAVWFRPPFGALRGDQAGIVKKEGLDVVMWSVDSADWSEPGEDKIVETILTKTQPGSIILCHDWRKQTADCIGRVVDGLLERGYEFVTVSALLL